MKNKRVVFGSSVEYYDPSMGLKEWDRPTIEFDIDDDDDFLEYLRLAKTIIKDFYGKVPKYEGNYNIENPNGNSETVPPKDERIQSFIATINMCTSLKFLKNFEARVKAENNPELSMAYDNKLMEFSIQ